MPEYRRMQIVNYELSGRCHVSQRCLLHPRAVVQCNENVVVTGTLLTAGVETSGITGAQLWLVVGCR